MSLARIPQSSLQLWDEKEKLNTIKEIYGKNLTNLEFQVFCELGKITGLNPFLRELWAVKYGDSAAQIFIGRDGYRKSAQANPNYDYHLVDSVYENDSFAVSNGIVSHSYNLTNRGKLIGAYCLVKRKNSSCPTYVFVELKEYSTGKSLWSTKQATMIKKVAEAQALRMAFQELFGGTYDESEEDHVLGRVIESNTANENIAELNNKLGLIEQYDMSEICKTINESKTMLDLELNFKLAYKTVKTNANHIAVITELKDKRKAELNSANATEQEDNFFND